MVDCLEKRLLQLQESLKATVARDNNNANNWTVAAEKE